jgi:hypothetical protein
MIKNVNLMRFL